MKAAVVADFRSPLQLHDAGRTRVIAVERKLDEVNECINEVLSRSVPARVVFRL